jgi:hypothetical protein
MTFTPITKVHGGGERRTPPCDGRNAGRRAHMRQQAKVTLFRLAPVVMLVVTVAAPRKW